MSVTATVEFYGPHFYSSNAESEEAVRLTFNPSALTSVTRLKLLSTLFIAECEKVTREKPEASRELAVAKTNMQTASMWAVLGATKGL